MAPLARESQCIMKWFIGQVEEGDGGVRATNSEFWVRITVEIRVGAAMAACAWIEFTNSNCGFLDVPVFS